MIMRKGIYNLEENWNMRKYELTDETKIIVLGKEFRSLLDAPAVETAEKLISNPSSIRMILRDYWTDMDKDQNNPYHVHSVEIHTFTAYKNLPENADFITKTALLLHDIGKPLCRKRGRDGYDHFHGHAKVSADIAGSILREFDFTETEIQSVTELIKRHDLQFEPTREFVTRMLNRLGREQFERLIMIREADILGQNPDYSGKRIEKVAAVRRILEDVLADRSRFQKKDLAVNGNDLIRIGYREDETLGEELNFLCREVLDGNIENNRDALLTRACQDYQNSYEYEY